MSATRIPVKSEEIWVIGKIGRLFARLWSTAKGQSRAPIVLFHDSLGSVDLWRNFPEELCRATGREVIAYDRLGFGKSDRHPGMLNLDFITREADRDFASIKDQLGIDHFVAFGHSVGGGMAVNCAARYKQWCTALITEAAQAFVEDKTLNEIEASKNAFKGEEHFNRLRKYHDDKAGWVLASWTESWLHPSFASWTLAPILPNITCPALVIHGLDDEYGSQRHPKIIAENLGGPVQLEMLPATRHVPHKEKTQVVVELVQTFLAPMG